MPFLGFNPKDSTTAASNTIADTTTIGDGTAECKFGLMVIQ